MTVDVNKLNMKTRKRKKTAIFKVVKNNLHEKPQKLIVGINLARK